MVSCHYILLFQAWGWERSPILKRILWGTTVFHDGQPEGTEEKKKKKIKFTTLTYRNSRNIPLDRGDGLEAAVHECRSFGAHKERK